MSMAPPIRFPAVALTDDEQRRFDQIVAGNVFPHLPIEIFPIILDDGGRGRHDHCRRTEPLMSSRCRRQRGIALPAAATGTVKRYLSESEVADRHRDRFAIQTATSCSSRCDPQGRNG